MNVLSQKANEIVSDQSIFGKEHKDKEYKKLMALTTDLIKENTKSIVILTAITVSRNGLIYINGTPFKAIDFLNSLIETLKDNKKEPIQPNGSAALTDKYPPATDPAAARSRHPLLNFLENNIYGIHFTRFTADRFYGRGFLFYFTLCFAAYPFIPDLYYWYLI